MSLVMGMSCSGTVRRVMNCSQSVPYCVGGTTSGTMTSYVGQSSPHGVCLIYYSGSVIVCCRYCGIVINCVFIDFLCRLGGDSPSTMIILSYASQTLLLSAMPHYWHPAAEDVAGRFAELPAIFQVWKKQVTQSSSWSSVGTIVLLV